MASLDRILSIHAVADICSSAIWPESGVARVGRGTGSMGVPAAFDFIDSYNTNAGARSEDQELLAELIAPVAFSDAVFISKYLIHNFGSLPQILAKIDDDMTLPHLPMSVITHLCAVKHMIARVLRRDIAVQPILSTSKDLLDYLHFEMAHLERETLRVLFLDSANRLIHDRTMWQGTVNSVQCHPREILSAALHRKSSAMILAHNHPSGNPRPSADDIRQTRELCIAASHLNIVVHDHIIISSSNHFSMRAEGFLDFKHGTGFTERDVRPSGRAGNVNGWPMIWENLMARIL